MTLHFHKLLKRIHIDSFYMIHNQINSDSAIYDLGIHLSIREKQDNFYTLPYAAKGTGLFCMSQEKALVHSDICHLQYNSLFRSDVHIYTVLLLDQCKTDHHELIRMLRAWDLQIFSGNCYDCILFQIVL